ncbi:Fasciclin-like arabinogalactan protein [Rhynchospora pubera]|uniref:Fasciclin-like arabinogalactan protein n=1 Tax=Rhynchospora pubera TaxID=906938 RepID=A0AAV8CYX6_9POAL|nr:Fasciclin-like arabinogalactan protein [Rhynchospora pubera]
MALYHLLICLSLALLIPTNSQNITAILDNFPEYSTYNSYLSQTKVCDEINSHETVTCLVLPNSAMSSLVSKQSLAGIKNALRLLSLLDYFDPQKLHDLTRGTTLTTTLYQTTGNAPGNLGFVNITNLRGGRVGFASAKPGSAFDATYTKSVKQIPYNLSVLEISAPITFPGLMDAPAPSNLTALLEKAGCKIFASLISSSGVLKMYESAMDKGFTLFAPNDDAFKADGVPDLTTMSSADLVTVLQYHALPSYKPKASLKTTKGAIATMASGGPGNYDLSVITHGDDVSLDTGVDTSRVASTVLDDTPTCVLTVDNILLPSELFGGAPTPSARGPLAPSPLLGPATAPAPEEAAPSDAPAAEAPAPSPKSSKSGKKKKASPHAHSPPAPPDDSSPEAAPSDAPAADESATPNDKGAAAMRSIAGPASLLFGSVCMIVTLGLV